MIVALAGGVGAARMLRALGTVVNASELAAIINTGDDCWMHGLRISPDIDTVTYTLAEAIDPDNGWGLAGESWSAMAELSRLSGKRLGWFNLGDRDLGTHLYRTTRLGEGATLSQVTAEISQRWGIGVALLPMSDDPVATHVKALVGVDGIETAVELGFQEYFVRHRHDVEALGVAFHGIDDALPAPGVIEAINTAHRIVICPSNPIVSIGPVLSVPGIGEAVAARRAAVVAVSPIVGGRALKGPADRLMRELGHDSSVGGVARLWSPFASTLVIDPADEHLRNEVEDAGMRCIVTPTVMSEPGVTTSLARALLDPDALDPIASGPSR